MTIRPLTNGKLFAKKRHKILQSNIFNIDQYLNKYNGQYLVRTKTQSRQLWTDLIPPNLGLGIYCSTPAYPDIAQPPQRAQITPQPKKKNIIKYNKLYRYRNRPLRYRLA